MAKQVQDAYIVAATRSPVGKAPRGMFRNVRPDDLLAHVLKATLAQVPGAGSEGDRRCDRRVRDSRSGAGHECCARGAAAGRVARHGVGRDGQSLLLLGPAGRVDGGRSHPAGRGRRDDRSRHREHEHDSDGRQQDLVQRAHLRQRRERRDRLRHGHHGRESRRSSGTSRARRRTGSRWRAIARRLPPPRPASSATRSRLTRSTRKCPISPRDEIRHDTRTVAADEGPRADTSPGSARKLRPAFAAKGSVTAGNSSQTSDGAGAVIVVSEAALKRFNLQPLAPLSRLRRGRRAARDHGDRTQVRHSQGAQAGRPQAGRSATGSN